MLRLGSSIVDAFNVGQTVGGKYRIERVIGRGGMGVVVEAQHLVLSARVAIKFLVPELAQNAEAAARFLREARTTFGVRSPHIVSVLDVGHTEAGLPFIVMEYLEGEDVSARLQRLGHVSEREAIEIVRQAALGVAYAHARGIIHRDLKPSNLLCSETSDGEFVVKVVDFGISKLTQDSPLDKDGLVNTQTATVLGSPLYMAPEQLQSAKHLDEGCDIWALGVILFELLTGRPPFLGKSVTEVAINVATQPLPSLGESRADVSSAAQAIVARCLQKVRADRYATIEQLLTALRDCARGASSEVPSLVRTTATTPTAAEPSAAEPSAAEPSASQQGAPLGASLAAIEGLSPIPAYTPSAVPAIASPNVQTLTLDAAPSAGSSTGAPVSNTHAPGAVAKRRWTQVGAAALASLLTVLAVTWGLRGGSEEGSETPAAADLGGPPATELEPAAAVGKPASAGADSTRAAVTPSAESPSTMASSSSIASARRPESSASAPATTLKSAGRDTTTAPTKRSPVPAVATASSAAAGSLVTPRSPAPCVPYYMRNGVRVFNDACILEREAQKGRVAPEPPKTRKP
jgi:eukaryotic-like serine/threonine-protein kinase